MAQFYTLEEAAERLGLSTEAFKRRQKTEWTNLKVFRDGSTLRFRSSEIDELARSLGETSDPDLQLAPPSRRPAVDDSDDFELGTDEAPPISKPASGKTKRPGADSDVRLSPKSGPLPDLGDNVTEEIALDLSGPGSAIIRPGQSGKLAAPKSGKLSGGSSAKLGSGSGKLGGGSGKSGKSGKIPGPTSGAVNDDGSSEFELSLDPDSDSFELQLATDESEEVDLGGADLGAGENLGALSGIHLGKPADSGLLLEKDLKSGPMSGPKTGKMTRPVAPPPSGKSGIRKPRPKTGPRSGKAVQPSSDDDFDLSLDADEAPSPSKAKLSGGSSASGLRKRTDSASDFELTLDDDDTSGEMRSLAASAQGEGQNDIFETDFELPAIDGESGSEVVAVESDELEQSSDFDMAVSEDDVPMDDDESASQVVLVDDEAGAYVEPGDEDATAEYGEEQPSSSDSISGVMRRTKPTLEPDEDEEDVRTVLAAPARWGPLPAIVLLPTLLLVFLGGLMSFEMIRGMWGYHQPAKPGNLIVRSVADAFGMKAND